MFSLFSWMRPTLLIFTHLSLPFSGYLATIVALAGVHLVFLTAAFLRHQDRCAEMTMFPIDSISVLLERKISIDIWRWAQKSLCFGFFSTFLLCFRSLLYLFHLFLSSSSFSSFFLRLCLFLSLFSLSLSVSLLSFHLPLIPFLFTKYSFSDSGFAVMNFTTPTTFIRAETSSTGSQSHSFPSKEMKQRTNKEIDVRLMNKRRRMKN